MPEARVFRPKSTSEDELIDRIMEVHVLEGHIQRASWTQYVSYLINKDMAEIKSNHNKKVRGG